MTCSHPNATLNTRDDTWQVDWCPDCGATKHASEEWASHDAPAESAPVEAATRDSLTGRR